MNKIELARRLMDAGHAGDWQPLVDHLARDVVFKVTIPDGSPIEPEIRGKRAVVEHFTKLAELVEFRQEKPAEYFGRDDRVVIVGRESYEIKKTGQIVPGSEYATVLDFWGELITRFAVIQDMSAFVDAYRD